MKTRSKTKPIPSVGITPYGYDPAKKGQDKSFYYPDAKVLTKLEEAIVKIREDQQPVRKVAGWLENETNRKLSATRLHKLAWTKEELDARREKREANLNKQQKKVNRLKNTVKQTSIKAEQAKQI